MSFRTCFKIAACFGVMAASQGVYAQMRDINLYTQLGGGWGSANTLNAGGTLMYKHLAITYDYVWQRSQANNVPADYPPSLAFFDDGKPRETLDGHCFEGARVIYFGNGRLRFLARGGLFVGTYKAPEHYKKIPVGWYESTYVVDFLTKDATGLVLHPTIEWCGTVPFGGSTGVRIIVTQPKMSAAVDFNLLLGKVRKSRRHEKQKKTENNPSLLKKAAEK